MTTIELIPLDFCRVQNLGIRQIVKSHGIEIHDGMPALRIETIDESRPTLRRLVAYPPGQPINEDPGCYLGTYTINSKVTRNVYLAD